MMRVDIFDVPNSRSRNTIGTSRTEKLFETKRRTNSVRNAYPSADVDAGSMVRSADERYARKPDVQSRTPNPNTIPV